MFLKSQAELALSTRLKLLSDSLHGIANQAYANVDAAFDARAFPLLRFLQVHGSASVTQIATAVGLSHPAISQLAARLLRAGWLTRHADHKDARRRVIALSAQGEARLGRLGPAWLAIRRGIAAAQRRSRGDLLDALAGLEREIESGALLRDIVAHHARITAATPVIEPFRKSLRAHFYRINAEWLQRHFVIEAVDAQVLKEPESQVLKPGGAIFFALIDGEVIGTCALLHEAPGVYELSKMGVETGFRGLGVGRLLLEAAIAEFHRRNGRSLFLESSKQLTAALTLYESAGFVHQSAPRAGSHYQRADVYMTYQRTSKANGTSVTKHATRQRKPTTVKS